MIYRNIANKLRLRINSDEYSVGDLLPTERQLMEEFKASRVSVRKAIEELVALDLIEKRQGSGTFITHKDVVHQLVPLRSAQERSQEMGEKVISEVLEFSVKVPDSEIAKQLKIESEDKVYYVKRLRRYNGRPQILEESYLPVRVFPELNIRVLEGSKFQYIEKVTQLKIEGCYQEFSSIISDKEKLELLKLNINEPLLQIRSVANLVDGTPIDYSIASIKSSEHILGLYIPR
ncbi:GntR family transcriptional regulator [Vibrio salinus]|uniref:GntR family transcriptional regulator n=1 Tax=Vibrio salinus TaxID=2899784 RepID=UPI001E33FC82|nr:GntR family transcriptional regulator [Vibrio salinus]MCE0496162.1 GntR family transcriptional regulator [Vibrio salinus]